MNSDSTHTVKSYDEDLRRLNKTIAEMGGLAETQLAEAVDALVGRDSDSAAAVIESDQRIDQLEREVDASVVRLLALRQPMASDLRLIVAALKIASDIERIGDYAANVAKRAIALNQMPLARPVNSLPRMGRQVQQMIKDVLDAFVDKDAAKAEAVWNRDEEVDDTYNSLFRELLTYMMEDPRNISACIHLLFIAKNVERIGDHTTNIAETIHFMVHGKPIVAARPKGDSTAFAVIKPGLGEKGSTAQ